MVLASVEESASVLESVIGEPAWNRLLTIVVLLGLETETSGRGRIRLLGNSMNRQNRWTRALSPRPDPPLARNRTPEAAKIVAAGFARRAPPPPPPPWIRGTRSPMSHRGLSREPDPRTAGMTSRPTGARCLVTMMSMRRPCDTFRRSGNREVAPACSIPDRVPNTRSEGSGTIMIHACRGRRRERPAPPEPPARQPGPCP